MKITLEQAMELLDKSRAIIIDDGVLLYHTTHSLTDSDDNIFMSVSWDCDGYEFDLSYSENDNKEVLIEDGFLILKNNQGTEDRITLLVPMFVH